MKARLIFTVSLLVATSAAVAQDQDKEKHGHIGLASFATVIGNNIAGVEDDELAGAALFGGFAVNDHFGGRATLASQDHEDTSNIEASTFEANLMAGTGLATEGFKAYGNVGLFSETWEFSTINGDFETDFNGLMLGGGLGYNWNVVSLDFWVNFRDGSDYEDFLEDTAFGGTDVTAVSGGLGLSARF